MTAVTAEDLQALVGQVLGTSEWLLVDQDRIDRFADVTDDHQFIHVDPQRAAQTPLGGTVAHGFLTLSLIPHLSATSGIPKIANVKMGLNYGTDKVRFLAPVRAGKRIRGQFKLLSLTEKRPGEWQQINEVTIEIEGENKPALIAECISLIFV